MRALRLAGRGFILQPNPHIRRQLLRTMLPEPILALLREVKGRLLDLRVTR